MSYRQSFGEFLRRHREQQNITLRKFAGLVGMSPTYLSKVERDEMPPPSEEKIRAISKVLNLDPDELLARAGRVAADLEAIIQERPKQLAVLLRSQRALTTSELDRIIAIIRRRSG